MGWVIDSNQDCFFDGSSNIMVLSAHNAEIFNGEVMPHGVVVVMDGWGGPHVFSEPFCKSSA